MDGCDNCKIRSSADTYSECDLLGTYSYLCQSMPEMSQCSNWMSMCEATPSLSFCATARNGNANAPPQMRMYFHTGFADYILFEGFVPRTPGEYIGACIFTLLLAILYEALFAWLSIQELKWRVELRQLSNTRRSCCGRVALEDSDSGSTTCLVVPPLPSFLKHFAGYSNGNRGTRIAAMRGFCKTFMICISYALMLLAMTFNLGIFICVCIGFGLGSFMFTPIAIEAAGVDKEVNVAEMNTAGCCQ